MASIALEEYELLGDAKYRSYVSAIDKALKSFEYTSEWADLISALGKLNKVLLNNTKYPIIPRRITISKRLAQCMHPALPSGVHLKALETYDIIFKSVGISRLSSELFIYSAGLFPLLSHAAMNVKPALLTVYENHFVPLRERLRPGLNGFLVGVLPGLEEGTDYYERTDLLLQKVCDGVGKSYFYGCLWQCILSNPSIRLPAISYIIAHFNKKLSMEDQLYIIGTDIDIMVQGTSAALQDSSVLVQRTALDLLLMGFPMHNCQLVHDDMVRIVTAAITVVLRRDMSLNRRLFAWLLGIEASSVSKQFPDQNQVDRSDSVTSCESETSNSYFDLYSRDLLLEALRLCLGDPSCLGTNTAPSSFRELWCYRLLISLFDRPEISSTILDDILVEVFRSLYLECMGKKYVPFLGTQCQRTAKDNKANSEVIKTANLLFGTLDPSYLWHYCTHLLNKACSEAKQKHLKGSRNFSAATSNESAVQSVGSGLPTILEVCTLTNFLLDIVSLETYIETPTEHLPLLLRNIISALTSCCDILTAGEIEAYLKLSSKILSKAQPSVVLATLDSSSSTKADLPRFESLQQPDEKPAQEDENSKLLDRSTADDKSKDSRSKSVASTDSNHIPVDNSFNKSSDISNGKVENDARESKSPKSEDGCQTSSQITLCVEGFQDFFVKLTNCRLLKDPEQAVRCYRSLLVSHKEKMRQRDSELEELLYKCLYSTREKATKSENTATSNCEESKMLATSTSTENLGVELVDNVHCMTGVFRHACVILNELSSFPVYCTTAKCQLDAAQNNVECQDLPKWLQILLVFSCFVKHDEFHFAAIRAVLDLITLTKSIAVKQDISDTPPSPVPTSPTGSAQAGVYSVVIIPTVTNSELKFLWEETNFFERSAYKLWNYLDSTQSMHHIHTVELLQNLQNLAQDGSACESIICKSMTSESETEQIEARKKFCILWHLTRDIRLKSTPSKMTRAFDRPLFLMLESLGTETGPQKSIAQTWLNHCLQRGDIARILEPLLLILLHPDTARVSIQHVVIQHPRKVKIGEESESQENSAEAKIYAISSMGGNIIYHISSEDKFLARCSSPKKKILALTSIIQTDNNGESKVVTSNSMLQDFELPSVHERDAHLPIKMIVNPFGSLTSLVSDPLESSSPPDLSNAKRLDISSLLGKYSSFDVDDDYEVLDNASDKEETGLEIVSSILDEVIATVVSSEKNASCSSSNDKDYANALQDMFHDSENSHHVRDSESLYSDEQQSHSLSTSSDANQQQQKLGIYQLHNHILLYSQVYDSSKTTYALSALKAVILTNPRVALGNMATTSINSSLSPRGQELQVLLARHRKSLSGKNFHGDLSAEAVTAYRSHMFVDVIVSACLYYLRGYYPNLPQVRLTEEEIVGNQNVRLLCTEVLTLVFSELIGIVKESGKSFASYLSDLLSRCRVQRALLQCLVACVYNPILEKDNRNDSEFMFTKVIMDFNENSPWPDESKSSPSCDFQDTFQIHLLRLVATLIILEDCVVTQNNKDSRTSSLSNKTNKPNADGPSRVTFQQPMSAYKYHQGVAIPCQPMFLSCVSGALRQHNKAHLHTHWLALIMSALPFSGRSLTQLVIQVVSQLCRNLEMVAMWCSQGQDRVLHAEKPPEEEMEVPPDFLLTMVEGLTTLCHYCLLDLPASLASPLSQPPLPPIPYQPYAPGASQILYNLLHVFSTTDAEKDSSTTSDSSGHVDPLLSTRRALLSHLPRILAALVATWQAISRTEKTDGDQPKPWWIMGTPKAVKQHILSFLSPISLHHGSNFMTAVAVVWYECRQKNPLPSRKIMPVWSFEQQLLVELVGAIKVLPMEMVVQTVRQVIRQPPPIAHIKKKKVPVEVSILQFFLAYVQNTQGTQLVESWQSLLGLWKDGLQLSSSPPVQFHLLAILHEFVQRAPLLEDKKDQKDLQDIAQKLIETCSTIAGASLEQTRWLRRNLAVRPGPQHEISDSDLDVDDSTINIDKNSAKGNDSTSTSTASSSNSNSSPSNIPYSVQALSILAEFLAPVLDVVYVSEEKEKVVPLLTSIMYYVTPYLRNHSKHNAPSFRACSQLLSSISGYQYTRKAWKRDTFDLLLDPAFFQMDDSCVSYWRAIVDHLMTHDKTTFRDFLTRVSLTQSGSLNLFSSKEQEYEQRAQLLKRLAFVLFCSEVDQYQKYMPEIQERLSESLRLHQVPSVQAQVFLCFRVVLLRMSPHHVTSLWPLIITEMVQIFIQMEHELSTDSEEFRRASSSHLRRLSMLESSWVISGSNGLAAHNHPAWLQLYLSACKLLDLTVALPADMLPQFQMYRWAFVGDGPPPSSENNDVASTSPDFIPHIMRLASLLNKNSHFQSSRPESTAFVPGRPLLHMPSIKSMQQLQPFFDALANIGRRTHSTVADASFDGKVGSAAALCVDNKRDLYKSLSAPELSRCQSVPKEPHGGPLKSFLAYIEHILESDFLEPLPSS